MELVEERRRITIRLPPVGTQGNRLDGRHAEVPPERIGPILVESDHRTPELHADHIPAEFKDVMLDIGIAKRPESRPRRIAIKS